MSTLSRLVLLFSLEHLFKPSFKIFFSRIVTLAMHKHLFRLGGQNEHFSTRLRSNFAPELLVDTRGTEHWHRKSCRTHKTTDRGHYRERGRFLVGAKATATGHTTKPEVGPARGRWPECQENSKDRHRIHRRHSVDSRKISASATVTDDDCRSSRLIRSAGTLPLVSEFSDDRALVCVRTHAPRTHPTTLIRTVVIPKCAQCPLVWCCYSGQLTAVAASSSLILFW